MGLRQGHLRVRSHLRHTRSHARAAHGRVVGCSKNLYNACQLHHPFDPKKSTTYDAFKFCPKKETDLWKKLKAKAEKKVGKEFQTSESDDLCSQSGDSSRSYPTPDLSSRLSACTHVSRGLWSQAQTLFKVVATALKAHDHDPLWHRLVQHVLRQRHGPHRWYRAREAGPGICRSP